MTRDDAPTANWAIIGIFFFLLVYALAWSADFLTPITAAILGYLTFSPFERRLARMGVPSLFSAGFIIILVSALLAYIVFTFAEPTADVIDDLPQLIQNFSNELAGHDGTGALKKLNEAADAAQHAISPDGEDDALEVQVVSQGNLIMTIMGMAPAVLGQIVFALVLLFFLIASGDMFIVKIVESFSRWEDKKSAITVVKLVEQKLGHYLGSIFLINAGLGICIALAMWAWGLPNPPMYAFIAFALNFIPFVGAVVGAVFAGLAAFSAFHDLWPTFGVFATYMLFTSFEGQFITPSLLSNRLKLNTTVVFLAVAFFAWIWSVIGMIVAVPILIVLKIVMDEIETTRPIAAFLGGPGDGANNISKRV